MILNLLHNNLFVTVSKWENKASRKRFTFEMWQPSSIVLFIIMWQQSSSFRKRYAKYSIHMSRQDLIKNSLKEELKVKNLKL